MRAEHKLINYLRFKRGLHACDEVHLYYCRADVLALDMNKKEVYEYEFKRSSQDLKVAELKKEKYREQRKSRSASVEHHVRLEKQSKSYKEKSKWFIPSLYYRYSVAKPHRFYYVVPMELWEKEKEYLYSLKNIGVIAYEEHFINKEELQFLTMRSIRSIKTNTQSYERAEKMFLKRISSAYANAICSTHDQTS